MRNLPVNKAVILEVNVAPLIDDTDFKSREVAVAFNAAGMDLVWNFVNRFGVVTQTAVTPTSGGVYDWTHVGDGMYTLELPASGGASINNDQEGIGYFSGIATGVLAWRGPDYEFGGQGLVYADVVNGAGTQTLTLTNGNGDFDDLIQGGLVEVLHGGLLVIGSLAISGVAAEKFKTTATLAFRKAGTRGTKAATDNLVFSAADTVNTAQAAGTFWGAWMVTYDGSSAFATQSPSADQVYTTEALALAAARALVPAAGTFPVGFIAVNSKANVRWTANTDDMTDASDCTETNFYDAPIRGGLKSVREVTAYAEATLVATVNQVWLTNLRPIEDVDEALIYAGAYNPSTDIAAAVRDVSNTSPAVGSLGEDVATAADNSVVLIASQEVYKKNTAVTAFQFPMETTGGMPGTGLTVTTKVMKDGGTFNATAASVVEDTDGWYHVDLSATEMNADEVAFIATASGAKQTNIKIRTQS